MLELDRFADYTAWADGVLAQGLHEHAPVGAIALLAHVVAAQRLWLDRIQGRAITVPVFPDWSLDVIAERVEANRLGFAKQLEGRTYTDLAASTVEYSDTEGAPYASSELEILTHLHSHGAHHRGQIAARIAANGRTPPRTDYIVFRRAVTTD